MALVGFLSAGEMLSVFSNSGPVTVAAMFVLSGALVRTGVIERVASLFTGLARGRPRLAIGGLMANLLVFPAFVNNTPVVILLIPVVKRLAAATGVAATRLLIPLSYLTIMSGTLTLIGTSSNLLVDGAAQALGQRPFGMFEFTAVGVCVAISGLATLAVLGPFLLPDRPDRDEETNVEQRFLSELVISRSRRGQWRRPADIPAFRHHDFDLVGIRRSGAIRRDFSSDTILEPGDTLIVTATARDLNGFAHGSDFIVGRGGRDGNLPLADAGSRQEPFGSIRVAIGPAHPAIGKRLSDLPFLSRLPVRILGVARWWHRAGPDLPTMRLRAGDELLIAAGPKARSALRSNVNLAEVGGEIERPFRRSKAPVAILTLAGVVGLSALGVAPISVLSLLGVGVVLLTGCIAPEEAWASIDGNVLVLIYAMLAIGLGVQNAGAVDLTVGAITPLIGGFSPLLMIAVVYCLASVLTEMVTNNAVAVLMTPIAIGIADMSGVDPRPLLVAVMFASSASFMTPFGYQTNTMVYAAADYRFSDFVRIGLPLNLVVGLTSCLAIHYLL